MNKIKIVHIICFEFNCHFLKYLKLNQNIQHQKIIIMDFIQTTLQNSKQNTNIKTYL
jgi:hypothetical protein